MPEPAEKPSLQSLLTLIGFILVHLLMSSCVSCCSDDDTVRILQEDNDDDEEEEDSTPLGSSNRQ